MTSQRWQPKPSYTIQELDWWPIVVESLWWEKTSWNFPHYWKRLSRHIAYSDWVVHISTPTCWVSSSQSLFAKRENCSVSFTTSLPQYWSPIQLTLSAAQLWLPSLVVWGNELANHERSLCFCSCGWTASWSTLATTFVLDCTDSSFPPLPVPSKLTPGNDLNVVEGAASNTGLEWEWMICLLHHLI